MSSRTRTSGKWITRVVLATCIASSPLAHADDAQRIDLLELEVNDLNRRLMAIEQAIGQGTTSAAPVRGSEGSRDKRNWRQLERGMSKDQVRQLIGEPDRNRVSRNLGITFSDWHYPRGGWVTFMEDEVHEWSEPVN